jgi:glycosyltransferase involved in cell wall biosynthesis
MCSKLIPKIKFEATPTEWTHHRGGWSYVLSSLRDLQAADGILFISAVEEVISEGISISEPWVGVIHQVPKNNYPYYLDLERLVKDKCFLESLDHCQGLFVLSQIVKDYLQQHLGSVPIAKVLYPITPFPPSSIFDWGKFNRKVVFIGEFMRNFQAFYDLEIPECYEKILLKSSDVDFDKLYNCQMEQIHLKTNNTVTIKERVSNDEYDEILSSSVIFLNLFDAPANTVVIECIGRNTPLVVNRLPGLEEYLGKDYPLFYDTLHEASALLHDQSKLIKGSDYLQSLPIKNELTKESFLSSFTNTAIYRSLPVPLSQRSDPPYFPVYDVSIVTCCYKRVYNLHNLLECFMKQDFKGTFEVIIWNNNSETQDEVAEIAKPFMEKLNIRLIQSTENYYCIIRLAVAKLVRSDYLLVCDDDIVPHDNFISTFVSKYEEYGPRAALCCRGHIFGLHRMNLEQPDKFWNDPDDEYIKIYFDEKKPDRQIHYIHGSISFFPRQLLNEAGAYDLPSPETVLVDDYWLSFVLSHHLHVPLWKFQGDGIFHSTPCSEDKSIALYYNEKVENERVNFYIYHMKKGWPESVPLDPYS